MVAQELTLSRSSFPVRPGYGAKGQKVTVYANAFPLTNLPKLDVYQYDLTVNPSLPPKLSKKLFEQVIKENGPKSFGLIKPVYDGRKNMYTVQELPQQKFSFEVGIPGDRPNRDGSPRLFRVDVTKVNTITTTDLADYISGKTADPPYEAIQVLEIVLRYHAAKKFTSVGRALYSPEIARQGLGDGIDVWSGYHQSIRAGEGKFYLNLDISATTFYSDKPVIELLADFLRLRDPGQLAQRQLPDSDRIRFEKKVKGLSMQVTHRADDKHYKITGLGKIPASKVTFTMGADKEGNGGTSISIADYFFEKYKRRLQFPDLPTVKVGHGKRQTELPMEVCRIVPGQRNMKKLTGDQTAKMIKFTCKKPDLRQEMIGEGLKRMDFGNNKDMQDFQLGVSSQMMTVEARVLDPPTLSYGDNPKFRADQGTWNLRSAKYLQPCAIGAWGVVVFGRAHPEDVKRFVSDLVGAIKAVNMRIRDDAPPIVFASADARDLKEKVLEVGQKVHAKWQMHPVLLLCILDNKNIYRDVKAHCELNLGVVTQCCLMEKMRGAKIQYHANLTLKINSKLGGVNHTLSNQIQLPILSKPALILGADVTHPSGYTGQSDGPPSIAAVVGSLNASVTKFAGAFRLQKGRTEIIEDLKSMVVELLKSFFQSTGGKKPEKIVFYRDGVSEGQFQQVLDFELRAIKEACAVLDPAYQPPVTVIIVQKRHHLRFFVKNRQDAERSGNIRAGTVIDRGVCHQKEFDFFLNSHCGLQGTSRPTRYFVVYDENKFTADSLQEFTYYQCYLFARCTKSVSVVPAAYYAHHLAFRARHYCDDSLFSDSASEFSSVSKGKGEVAIPGKQFQQIKINRNLVDPSKNYTMFFV